MQLWTANDATDNCLLDETRALFILKRAATIGEPPFEWTKRSAHILAMSANPAIAAEARRLDFGFDQPCRRRSSIAPSPIALSQDTVLWVSFSEKRASRS